MAMHITISHKFSSAKALAGMLGVYFKPVFETEEFQAPFQLIHHRNKSYPVTVSFPEEGRVRFMVPEGTRREVMIRLAQEINELEHMFLGGFKAQMNKVGDLYLVETQLDLCLVCWGGGLDTAVEEFDKVDLPALVIFDNHDNTIKAASLHDIHRFF